MELKNIDLQFIADVLELVVIISTSMVTGLKFLCDLHNIGLEAAQGHVHNMFPECLCLVLDINLSGHHDLQGLYRYSTQSIMIIYI